MVRGSLSAGEADQRTYPPPSGIASIQRRHRIDSLRASIMARMAQAIPFGSRSTADQVLAGIDLTRRRILVTECSSEVGFETMQALSANGAHIIGAARRLDDAQAACSAAGRSLTPLGCNPSTISAVDGSMIPARLMDKRSLPRRSLRRSCRVACMREAWRSIRSVAALLGIGLRGRNDSFSRSRDISLNRPHSERQRRLCWRRVPWLQA